jgi:hypothetical protein
MAEEGPLLERDRDAFEQLETLLKGEFRDAAPILMRAMWHGEPVAVICAVKETAQGRNTPGYAVYPVAIMVDDALAQQLTVDGEAAHSVRG